MLVMKAVLLPDPTDDRAVKHNKLDLQDVEDKYTITHLLVVLLKAHVEHMELRLAHRAPVVEAPCLESLESGSQVEPEKVFFSKTLLVNLPKTLRYFIFCSPLCLIKLIITKNHQPQSLLFQ